MSKKYQVFISSTYTDLIAERKAVEETIIRAGDIPVGMEAFPAADDEQFEFIKTVIDDCDYYVLILAGRYGTIAEDGLSYTEKEFRYAVEKEIPILVFLHSDTGSIPIDKSESVDRSRKKLEKFIKLASKKRMRTPWENIDALKLAVRVALDHAKATKPRPGWVRADRLSSPEILEENRNLRKRIDQLVSENGAGAWETSLPKPPSIEETTSIRVIRDSPGYGSDPIEVCKIEVSWRDLFPYFQASLACEFGDWGGSEYFSIDAKKSTNAFANEILFELQGFAVPNCSINEADFQRLVAYYTEVKFMYDGAGAEPFTADGKTAGRRMRIATGSLNERVNVVTGSLPISDEIPF
ncbi:protein of unknown function [Yoonia tamlensis]|uniref:DUF4062 domain-containing protein n=1 Tax=Yoonia tamlensis TaxID=390270 RepID=A0A1I6FZH5_9RHOB|nr:DUF4062 domain-containing protein [Yoonia tamlensis]SFR35247.1 protein of unknown function [Yoonia tamlensis]